MATEDGGEVQRAEKATLKRKLTGPPRLLLLGKTRSRSVGDRPEARTDKHKTAGQDESTAKLSAAAETDSANMDFCEVNAESSRGRCDAAGEGDDIRNRKVSRRRWWGRFSPAAVCNRKQKKDVEESLEKKRNVPPEGALQETEDNTEENRKGTKGKGFCMRAWPMVVHRTCEQKRDFVKKDVDEPLMTFRKKMLNIFSRGGKSRASRVPLENTEDTTRCDEVPWSPVAPVVEPAELDVTAESLEVVTVAAEMSLQLTESPDQTPTEEQLVCDVGVRDRSETVQTNNEVVGGPTVPVKGLMKAISPEKDQVFCDSSRVVPDAADQRSTWTSSSQQPSKGETTFHALQLSTNGPSIRIELVPPDDDSKEEEEEEECWEASSSSENHILLGFEHSEQQLLQTARSLVRAAVNAAVDQLTREQANNSDCVHRETLGCRDHA